MIRSSKGTFDRLRIQQMYYIRGYKVQSKKKKGYV